MRNSGGEFMRGKLFVVESLCVTVVESLCVENFLILYKYEIKIRLVI